MRTRAVRSTVAKPAAAVLGLALAAAPAAGQWTPMTPGSDNMDVLGHAPLGPQLSVADVELEQEMHRPYAYVARMVYGEVGPKGTDIINLEDPEHPEVIYRWRIENQDLHQRTGGMDVKYFKLDDRYYVVQSLQFGQGGPNPDLGAVILDVTGLPDPDTVREVARIREPELPGGFHNIFIYKHSDGRVLLLTTVRGPFAHVYDLAKVVDGDPSDALAGRIPVPESPLGRGAGRGLPRLLRRVSPGHRTGPLLRRRHRGYYVYDISDLEDPELVVTMTGINGVRSGHTFTPSPDGRYVIAETEYQYAPLRIFDLPARARGHADEHQRAHRGVDRRLAEPRAQPRGALALRLRLRIPRRPPGPSA